jgi:GNAT superfamily N-acetyltransferase
MKSIVIRPSTDEDIPYLKELIHLSVLELQKNDYSQVQLEKSLKLVYGVDTQLVKDGTYYTAELKDSDIQQVSIVGCGGWSQRKTLYGGDQFVGREDSWLNPEKGDPAKIRAFFIHPNYSRMGIGSKILERCEGEAEKKGFNRLEMGATLTGVPFYSAKGYQFIENADVPLDEGYVLPIVRMGKDI